MFKLRHQLKADEEKQALHYITVDSTDSPNTDSQWSYQLS